MLLNVGLTSICVILMAVYCDATSFRQKRIVGGIQAKLPESPANDGISPKKTGPSVDIQDYYRSATIIGTEEPEGYIAYKGIRFAKPPVEKLRLQVRDVLR